MTNANTKACHSHAANDAELTATSGYYLICDDGRRQDAREHRAAVLSLWWTTRALERQLDRLDRALKGPR